MLALNFSFMSKCYSSCSAAEASLKDIWSICDTDLDNNDKLFHFVKEFLAFPHDEHIDIIGHPTDLVHRFAVALLSFIRVFSNDSSESWSGEQFLLMTRKDPKLLKDASIIAEMISWNGKGPEVLLSEGNRRFLMLLHAVVKLCGWKHNLDLITILFGNSFFSVIFLLMPTMLSKLDELIVNISDLSPSDLVTDKSRTIEDICYLLSLLLAITQIPARLGRLPKEEVYGEAVNTSMLPPFSLSTIAQFGVDYGRGLLRVGAYGSGTNCRADFSSNKLDKEDEFI